MAAQGRPDSSDREAVHEYSDQLYKEEKWKELFEYLQEVLGSGHDLELTWRFLRGGYRYGKQALEARDNSEAERIADTAMERGERALEENDGHVNLHKWAGILLGLVGDIKGIKNRIQSSFLIREHFTKALELKPGEHFIRHLLGRWCYQVASVSWLQRKMASAIFATPPTSSFDEAFSYFSAAEEASPGFFKANWLWLGKCLVQMSRTAEAKQWLVKLMDTEPDTIDDKEARREAEELLRGL
jgi:tetratricopeptide (TPR) repeat protein